MSERLIVATRKSALALAQARAFVTELLSTWRGLEVEELHVVTTGDRVQDRALSEIGGKGLFIKEIEEALLDGRADFAIHSAKDLPAELAPGLAIGCIPRRADPRDVLVSRAGVPLAALPAGSKLGTSSLRRRVQIALARPDLSIVPLRGNVDTRLRKCEAGEVDAIVLAAAGLARLGWSERATEALDPALSLPAVAQGALAIEQRTGDERLAHYLAPLVDPITARAVAAERGVMLAVDGSCQVPVAAYALPVGRDLHLRALLAEPDGSRLRRDQVTAPWPDSDEAAHLIGFDLGRRLRAAVGAS